MSDLIVPNLFAFRHKKNPAILNNIQVLLKGVLINLRTRNFVHAKTSLRTRCVHARHRARNLSSPGPFIQSRKCMSLKFTGELCLMRMNNDAKFEEDLTCRLKIDMRNLMNLTQALKNLENLHHNGLLLTKVYNV